MKTAFTLDTSVFADPVFKRYNGFKNHHFEKFKQKLHEESIPQKIRKNI